MTYKSISTTFLLSAGLFLAFSVSAQTPPPSTDTSALMRQLQELVVSLQKQVLELQIQLNLARGDIETVKTEIKELKLTRSVARGFRGDDIRELQEFLKQDQEIYPEGLVTGFFGQATEAAVRRFQAKHGIESIGIVGPKTLQKINELITEGAGESGKIPPGLLTAPGIQKKLNETTIPVSATTTPDVPATTTPAIPAQPIGQTGTMTIPAIPAVPASQATSTVATSTAPISTPTPPAPVATPTPSPSPTPPPATSTDTTAPSTPTNLIAYAFSTSEIHLSWENSTDNIGVTGYKIYRDGAQITTVAVSPAYAGGILIYYWDTGLQTSATPYVYTVVAYDAAGNTSAQSASASAITQLPPIRVIDPNGGGTWEYQSNNGIYYKLNGVSRIGFKIFRGSQIIYTASGPITDTAQTSYALNSSNSSVVGSGSDYKIRVYDWDNQDVYDDSDSYFSILPGDFTPPVVSSVLASSITANSAVITWTTDEPATGYVNYGSALSGPSADWTITPHDNSWESYITSHSFILSNLKSNTLYTYRVYNTDRKGNSVTGYPPEYTFTTMATTTSINFDTASRLAQILESLKSILGSLKWLR